MASPQIAKILDDFANGKDRPSYVNGNSNNTTSSSNNSSHATATLNGTNAAIVTTAGNTAITPLPTPVLSSPPRAGGGIGLSTVQQQLLSRDSTATTKPQLVSRGSDHHQPTAIVSRDPAVMSRDQPAPSAVLSRDLPQQHVSRDPPAVPKPAARMSLRHKVVQVYKSFFFQEKYDIGV